jgi:alkanesulfonate monooxygenase
MREQADLDGFIEPHLWTGIGKARSGCGAAIVGNPDQVLAKIKEYMDMGIRGFIFSGYPHLDECKLFANYVLPNIKSFSMPEVQGRKPLHTPMSPLAGGIRN